MACMACCDLLSLVPLAFLYAECAVMCCCQQLVETVLAGSTFCPWLGRIQVIHSKQTRKTPRDMARRDEVAPRMYQPYREDRRRDDWRYDRSRRGDRGSSRCYKRYVPTTPEFSYFLKGMKCCAWLCSHVSADAIWISDDHRAKSDKSSQRQMSCDLYAGVLAHAPKAPGGDGTAAETGDVSAVVLAS